jgi:hypothetical protein
MFTQIFDNVMQPITSHVLGTPNRDGGVQLAKRGETLAPHTRHGARPLTSDTSENGCSTTQTAWDRFDFSIFDGSRPEKKKTGAIQHN